MEAITPSESGLVNDDKIDDSNCDYADTLKPFETSPSISNGDVSNGFNVIAQSQLESSVLSSLTNPESESGSIYRGFKGVFHKRHNRPLWPKRA